MVRVMSDSADVALFAELMLAKTNPRAQTDDIRTPLKNRVKASQRRCHICAGTRHTSATHLHRDWPHPLPHLPGTGLTPCHICPGLGPPVLHAACL
jgi:hypothetical protein